MMERELRELTSSPIDLTIVSDEINETPRLNRTKLTTAPPPSRDHPSTETELRQLLTKDISEAWEKGLCVCRLWQLLLTLSITIILIMAVLILALIFLIGPLFPYQTYGQSCKAVSCNAAYGLVCNSKSICVCPSADSYWSNNQTSCRRCPTGWSNIVGRCIFASMFTLNWTDALVYCNSVNAQLLTMAAIKPYSNLSLSDLSSLVAPNTNYFIGLSEQPSDSGNWQWVDGSSLSSSANLFCANGSTSQFDSLLRTNMHCGIYRMDKCLARYTCQRADVNFLCEKNVRSKYFEIKEPFHKHENIISFVNTTSLFKMTTDLPNIANFLHDDRQDKLVIYEIEFDKLEDPNEKFCNEAKVQGQCACRLWLILILVNTAVVVIVMFLLLLILTEVGPVPPYQSYGKQCSSVKCDSSKGLVCDYANGVKVCQCPSNGWYWYRNSVCRECPPNWIVSNNKTGCYFVSYARLTFADANKWCIRSQSRLLEIQNSNAFSALQSIKDFGFSLTSFYWTGLLENAPNSSAYTWITSGSVFTNANYFCVGQPSHGYSYYLQEYYQCVGLYIQSNTSSCLSDSACSNVSPFICELY